MERTLEKSAAPVLVPAIAVTDGELLMRFAQHGDEQAFAALVEKHGRLVWAVCWQVLREHHAIEDAFQSTFFILAKRARTIRSCDSLCGWLYRVAYRTALRARMSTKAKPLSALGTEADTMEEWSEFDEKLRAIEQDEQRIALLEELHALPEKYQQVLALCYLEGKTRRGIADELGCSMETVKGRLARGRQVLRHRLIRRGVSLSLAMAAMTVPVQSATAAVTPGLIGLTVTGATAWAAGTLGAAKIASGAGAAKAAATASSQVIHLAQQGTVAMTIASFAKPAVVAVALLGAVSGTLAVDSSDAPKGGGEAQTINLAANVNVSEDTVTEAAAPAVTVAAIEESATENGESDSNKKSKPQTWTVEDFVVEKKRIPAPPRSSQPIKIRAPGVPANVIIPDVPPMPEMPVVAPLDIHVPRFNLKMQLKLAALEAHVSELLLESKNLEIEAMSAAGEEEQQVLLQKSREKLTRAEAEKLKIQLEQQKEQIKALEEALREQTEQFGKQAAKMAAGAEVIAAQAEKAAGAAEAQAAIQAKEAAQHAAKAALRIQERAVIFDQASGRTLVANQYPVVSGLPNWEQSIEAQQGALSLKPGDRIQIEILHNDNDHEYKESDVYTVEPMGTVALGAEFGRAEVKGLSVIDAENVIREVISKVKEDAKVQVTYLHPTVPYSAPPLMNAGEFRYAPASNVKPSKVDESK